MKYVSIFSVTLKSAMTPSFMGLMATTLPGVRPSMSFASRPTATTSPLDLLMATMDGSLTTIPLPCANTKVLAVPRSIARSEENRLKTDRKLNPFFITSLAKDPVHAHPRLYTSERYIAPGRSEEPVRARPSRHESKCVVIKGFEAPVHTTV